MTTQADRVAEMSADTGTGTLVLSGAPVGYRTFSSGFGAGANTEVYYGIIQDLTGEWEIGLGTFLGPSNALRRDLVLSSSNSGALTSFPIGQKMIYSTFPADSTLTLRSRRTTDRTLTLEGANPNLNLHETDQTDPAGRYRHHVASDVFYFQRALTAAWATQTNIWSYAGATATFTFTAPVNFTGVATFTTAVPRITSSTPTLQFLETDAVSPAGQFALYGTGAGDFAIGRYTAASFGTLVALMTYDGGTDQFYFGPKCSLATVGNVVEVGGISGAMVYFKRTSSVNYLQVVAATSLRVQNDATTPVAWATISSASGWVAGTSDIRLKDNVQDIHYGMDTILQLRAIEFDRKSDGVHDLGLVSQEVRPIVPEVVEESVGEEGEETMLFLRKDGLVPILIKALQEMHARLVALEEAKAA